MVPNKIPNLIQILFRGFKIVEFNKPKIKKIIARTIAQILILPSFNNGNNDIIKKYVNKENSLNIYKSLLSLPSATQININELNKVVKNINSFYEKKNKTTSKFS